MQCEGDRETWYLYEDWLLVARGVPRSMANAETMMNIRNTQERKKLLSTPFRDVN